MTERTVAAPNDVGLAWFRVAVLYFLIAVVIGVGMGMRENFSLLSVHSHMNLLGWESLALIGLIYHHFPAVGRNRVAKVHFWIHNVGLPVMMVALVAKSQGNVQVDPLLGISSMVVGVGIAMFAANILVNARSRSIV
jgi:hypothetical protein